MKPKNYEHGNKFIKSLRVGDELEFNYFFSIYYRALCFFASRFIQDQDSVHDIVEESFIKLWQNREQIKDEKHLRNWLYKVTYHACLKWIEKQRAEGQMLRDKAILSDTEEKDHSENMIRAETLRQVREALEGLPPECKKVFYKLYIEGKTANVAAEELQVSINTIKTHRKRGLKLLRLRLGKGFLFFTMLW
jgi:RNA polymerase sigma-70 factor (ECF subfamily)